MATDLQHSPNAGEAESEAVGGDFCPADDDVSGPVDSDLTRIIEAWPTLLADVRAKIIAMIESASSSIPNKGCLMTCLMRDEVLGPQCGLSLRRMRPRQVAR